MSLRHAYSEQMMLSTVLGMRLDIGEQELCKLTLNGPSTGRMIVYSIVRFVDENRARIAEEDSTCV